MASFTSVSHHGCRTQAAWTKRKEKKTEKTLASFASSEATWTKKVNELGYPELCHNRLDCFCFVLNLVGVEQN